VGGGPVGGGSPERHSHNHRRGSEPNGEIETETQKRTNNQKGLLRGKKEETFRGKVRGIGKKPTMSLFVQGKGFSKTTLKMMRGKNPRTAAMQERGKGNKLGSQDLGGDGRGWGDANRVPQGKGLSKPQYRKRNSQRFYIGGKNWKRRGQHPQKLGKTFFPSLHKLKRGRPSRGNIRAGRSSSLSNLALQIHHAGPLGTRERKNSWNPSNGGYKISLPNANTGHFVLWGCSERGEWGNPLESSHYKGRDLQKKLLGGVANFPP